MALTFCMRIFIDNEASPEGGDLEGQGISFGYSSIGGNGITPK